MLKIKISKYLLVLLFWVFLVIVGFFNLNNSLLGFYLEM